MAGGAANRADIDPTSPAIARQPTCEQWGARIW
jgi:hypothetical protein